jgi:hypothetical protein
MNGWRPKPTVMRRSSIGNELDGLDAQEISISIRAGRVHANANMALDRKIAGGGLVMKNAISCCGRRGFVTGGTSGLVG